MRPWLLVPAFLVGVALGWLLFRGHPADPVVIAAADTVLFQGPAAAAVRDTITRRITRIVADTAQLRAAEARSDSALAALATAQTAADSVPLLLTSVHSLQQANAEQTRRFGELLRETTEYRTVAEARIDRLETTLRATRNELVKARRSGPCSVGTVSAGWSPITGQADLVLGGSCRVLALAGRIF